MLPVRVARGPATELMGDVDFTLRLTRDGSRYCAGRATFWFVQADDG